jgi:hypothetical protein
VRSERPAAAPGAPAGSVRAKPALNVMTKRNGQAAQQGPDARLASTRGMKRAGARRSEPPPTRGTRRG